MHLRFEGEYFCGEHCRNAKTSGERIDFTPVWCQQDQPVDAHRAAGAVNFPFNNTFAESRKVQLQIRSRRYDPMSAFYPKCVELRRMRLNVLASALVCQCSILDFPATGSSDPTSVRMADAVLRLFEHHCARVAALWTVAPQALFNPRHVDP